MTPRCPGCNNDLTHIEIHQAGPDINFMSANITNTWVWEERRWRSHNLNWMRHKDNLLDDRMILPSSDNNHLQCQQCHHVLSTTMKLVVEWHHTQGIDHDEWFLEPNDEFLMEIAL